MGSLVGRFLALVTFNAGPQDLPYATGLRNQTVILYLVLGVLVMSMSLPVPQASLSALLGTLVMLVFAAGLPWVHGYPARITQTVTALAGAGVIFWLLSWPVVWVFERSVQASGEVGLAPQLALLVLQIWNLGVIAHVLRHALSRGLGMGIAYALLYLLVAVGVSRLAMAAG